MFRRILCVLPIAVVLLVPQYCLGQVVAIPDTSAENLFVEGENQRPTEAEPDVTEWVACAAGCSATCMSGCGNACGSSPTCYRRRWFRRCVCLPVTVSPACIQVPCCSGAVSSASISPEARIAIGQEQQAVLILGTDSVASHSVTAEEIAAASMDALETRLVSHLSSNSPLTAEILECAKLSYGAGYHHYWQGDYRAALRYLDTSVEYASSDARAWYYKGLAELALGQKDVALQSLHRAVVLHERDPGKESLILKSLERIQGDLRCQLLQARRIVQSVPRMRALPEDKVAQSR